MKRFMLAAVAASLVMGGLASEKAVVLPEKYARDPGAAFALVFVMVTDDTEAGEMDYVFRRTAGEILDRESIHYVRDTGRLLRAPGFDFAKVTAFHVSWD